MCVWCVRGVCVVCVCDRRGRRAGGVELVLGWAAPKPTSQKHTQQLEQSIASLITSMLSRSTINLGRKLAKPMQARAMSSYELKGDYTIGKLLH